MNLNTAEMPFSERLRETLLQPLQDLPRCEARLIQEERRKERMRIARELHDTLLQSFLGASMQLCLVDEWLPADSPAKPLLQHVLDLIRKGIDEGRTALLELRSPTLPEGSLEKALSRVGDQFAPHEGTHLRIVVIGQAKSLSPEIQAQTYLIAREALLNALRHGNAGEVEVEIEYLRRKVRVVVRDDGAGIDPQVLRSGQGSHWGLVGMQERAANVGAKLRVWSKQGGGTEVELSVPL